MERVRSFEYMIFLTSLMTRWDASFMKYVWQNSKKFFTSHNINTVRIILFKSSIGDMEFAASIAPFRNCGRATVGGRAIFFPAIILSTSGIIMPMEIGRAHV